ncbi:MAG TPA: peptidyl-prolyl cis-trans isomerase [Gemmatimonadaceae bacterium]|nr:peptidyl-prolyl cis-trans isomerase [Gemmatimonadaceae bacterium]
MLQSMRSAAKYIWILLVVAFVGGFLLLDTSGLLGRPRVTNGTAVATVNGEDITYVTLETATQNLIQSEEARLGRSITLDERQRLENEAFEQLVNQILLRQELERRGISASDEEIRQAALNSPPPQLMQAPELQTEGRFDIEKYRRFLASPAAQQQGIRLALEQYYRAEIPRQKLINRVVNDVYVTDTELWRMWRDQHDSAQVSYVAFPADSVPDSAVTITDDEIRRFYEQHERDFVRVGRATVSLITIPRVITAADSQAARQRTLALRQEIVSGQSSFEDVARRESADTASGAQGGSLGRGTLESMNFVPEFTAAVRGLPTGQVSEPVLTSFGYHLIKVDERQGDTLSLRHILVPITQSDSSATRTDRRADSVANALANGDRPAKFDSVAKAMGLAVTQHTVTEGDMLVTDRGYVPDVTAWAFGGVQPGYMSDLIAADDAYYLARLDSLAPGGQQELEQVRDEIRDLLERDKKIQALMPRGTELAKAAVASTLEAAAKAQGREVRQTPTFTRLGGAPGLGAANQAIGAAFALKVGAVSQPVPATDALVVLRVDRRVEADSAAWVAQKQVQRYQLTQATKQRRWEQFLTNLRRSADIDDRRAEVRAAIRGTTEG